MKKFKVFAAALAICAVSVTAGGCSDDNKIGKWFDQVLCAHEWDDGEVVKEATCASKGEIKYTCESCEKTKTEKTDKIPHTEVEIELEATCAKEGLTDGVKCAVCEEVLQQPKVVAKIPHFEVPNSEAVAATCTTAGLKPGTHCARCDEVISTEMVIPALGHTEVLDAEAVAATCTTAGLKPGTHCARCDEVISTEMVIPALGHSDNDSNDICDICSAAKNIIEDMPEVDEFVAGKTYRIYYMEGYKPTGGYGYQPYFYIDVTTSDGDTVALAVTPGGESFASASGTRFVFEDSFGDNYRDVTIKAGTYTAPDANGNQVSFTIDENTVISNVSLSPTEYQGYVRRIEKSW